MVSRLHSVASVTPYKLEKCNEVASPLASTGTINFEVRANINGSVAAFLMDLIAVAWVYPISGPSALTLSSLSLSLTNTELTTVGSSFASSAAQVLALVSAQDRSTQTSGAPTQGCLDLVDQLS